MGKILKSPAALVINEAVRPELVEFGSANLRDENIRQFHAGEASPRYGFTALANGLIDGTSPTNAYKLFADSNTVVRIADGLAETFDASSSRWVPMPGRPSECAAGLIELPSLGTRAVIEDIQTSNGYVCVLWRVTSAGLLYNFTSIVNAATGAVVVAPTQIGGATTGTLAPGLGVNGNVFIVVSCDIVSSTISAYSIDVTSATSITTGWLPMTNLAIDADASSGALAVCSLPGSYCVLAYANNSGGTNQLTVKTFTSAGVTGTVTVNTSSFLPQFIDAQGSLADTIWISWNENTAVRLRGLNPANPTGAALATTATLITAGIQPTIICIQMSGTAGQGRLWVNDASIPGTSPMRSYTRGFQTSGGVAAPNGAMNTIYSALASGRPALVNSRYYIQVIVSDSLNTQQQVVLVDWTDDLTFVRPVACPAPGLAQAGTGVDRHCNMIPGASAGTYLFGISIAKSGVAAASALVVVDFNATTRWQPAPWGDSAYLTGGILQYSDGRRIAEAGFLARPPTPTFAKSGTGITLTSGRRYVCVYEEVDNDGNWHQSGLSSPSVSTGAVANQTVTVSTLPLSVSSRIRSASAQATGVRVAFYATADGGVAPYYRLGTTINNTGLASVDFADAIADTTLIANAELYSQPGVLGTAQDRRPPPGLALLTSYNGMLVGATGSNVWFSGQAVDGEGAWFNPIFQVPVPGQGDIMALAVMDGGLYIFKQREVYSIVGSPPSDNGATGGLGTPVRLACDVGCIESRSIATTALGIFFQSDRGIELLTRAQTVQWVGQKIQQKLADFPIVTSATVQPTPSGAYVLIELAASQSAGLVTGTGRTLVFDLSLNEWVSIDRRTSVNSVADAPSQSACMIYTGTAWRYAWMATNGYVHYENPATYLDADGSFTVQLIETGFYHSFDNETRVESVYLRYQRYAPAGITCETAYDDQDYVVEPEGVATWTEDDTGRQNFLQWSPKARGETVKFRITVTAPATANLGTGQGIGLISVSLNIEEEQGPTNGSLRGDPALRR